MAEIEGGLCTCHSRWGRVMKRGTAVAAVVIATVIASGVPASAATTATKLNPNQISSIVTQKLGKLKIATGNTTRGVNGKTITIEGIASVSQAGTTTLPGSCDGAKAAFAAANRQGGVNGYKINYLGCHDDGTNPTTANQLTQTAVEQNNVFAMVPWSSQGGSATLLNKDHVPYIGFGYNQAAYCGWNNTQFGFSVTSAEGCIGAVKGSTIFSNIGLTSYTQGVKVKPSTVKLAILSQAYPDSETAGNAEVVMGKALGMKVVYNKAAIPGPTSPQLTDYSPIVHQIMASGANFLFDDASGASVLSVAGGLKAAGWKGAMQQFTFTDASFLNIAAVAQAMDGVYALTAQVGSSAFPSPAIKQVQSDLKAIGSDAPVGLGTLTSYGSAKLFLAVLKQVKGPLTTEKFAAILNGGYKYPGYGNAVCPSTWPAAHVAASNCGAFIQLSGKTLKPILNLGNYGTAYLISGL